MVEAGTSERNQRKARGRVVDALIALALFALGVVNVMTTEGGALGPAGSGTLIIALQTIPLYVRRRFPLVVLVIVTVASSIPPFIGSIGDNLFSLLAVTIAVYTVAAYGRAREAVAGVLIALAGGLMHQVPQMEGFDPIFLAFAWLPMGAAAFVGSQVQLGRQRTRRVEDEGKLALWEKERESRRAISEERARIARELHDLVAHNMTSMALQAGAARMYFDSNPGQAREVLHSIEVGSRKALAEMRRLLGVLRTEDDRSLALAPQPSLSQLDDLVRSSEAAGLDINVSVQGEPTQVSPGLDLTVYRILQEALTNSLKHGSNDRPTSVNVRYHPDHLELKVSNPFSPKRVSSSEGGHGLVGMKERTTLFKGEFRAQSPEPGEFEVWVKLPLEPVP